jgi:Protein of unknown function (DUF2905)
MPVRHTSKQELKVPKCRGSILRWYNSDIRKEGRLCAYHRGGSPRWTKVVYRPKIANCVMVTFLKILIFVVLALASIGWLADRRAAANRSGVTPELSVRIYFPIVTSIILSVLLTLILRLFG